MLIVVVFSTMVFASCTKTPPDVIPPDLPSTEEPQEPTPPAYEEGSYTLLIYMCGSTLETKNGAATKNITEMLGVDLPEKTNVVIQTGGAKRWRNYDIPSDKFNRYVIKNNQCVLEESVALDNMGSSESLSDFIRYGLDKYPAEHTGLILWNHGGGSLKGVCFDENYAMDGLTIAEMNTAFKAAELPKKFDWIGFDACLMATVETAYMLEPYTLNMIASEEKEPSGGWNYATILSNLGKDSLYSSLLTSYAEKSTGKDYYTLSHVDFSNFDDVKNSLSKLITAMKTSSLRNVVSAVSDSLMFGSNGSNLYDFGNICKAYSIKESIASCVSAVSGDINSGASGLSIYFPLYDATTLDEYSASTTVDTYSDYLNLFYKDKSKEKISFISYAEQVDNKLSFLLTNESMDYLGEVDYVLYQYNDEELKTTLNVLGEDNDVSVVGNRITVDFTGNWVSVGGKLIYCTILQKVGDFTIYQAPVEVNYAWASIVFTFDSTTRQSEIIGVIYDDDENGRYSELSEGDLLCFAQRKMTESGYTEVFPPENEMTYTSTLSVDIVKLPDANYQYTAFVKDVYGKVYTAGTAVVKIENGVVSIITVTSDEVTYPE